MVEPGNTDVAEDPQLQSRLAKLLTVGEECQTVPELTRLLQAKGSEGQPRFNLYDGFEPSGRMHIAQGIFKAINVNKCTDTGGHFIFWVADWFGLMNDKMGGDMEKIQVVGKYLIEVWKAAGMNMEHVEFRWCEEAINNEAEAYWGQCLDIARRFTVSRIKKCCTIMGRGEGGLSAAQILYPIMQCTDIFFLKADICQLGVDQRKVNMLAREYCDAAGLKKKPVILSHHMLFGLLAGQAKMSKSDPDSAVFMEDTREDLVRKFQKAYCPKEAATGAAAAAAADEDMHLTKDDLANPCLDYVKQIVFGPDGATFIAGGTTFSDAESVREAFLSGALSEDELKAGLVEAVDALLAPVRHHFETDATAKGYLDQIKEWKANGLDKTAPASALKRLRIAALEGAGELHAVFAPVPYAQIEFEEVLNILALLTSKVDTAKGGLQAVLVLEDWNAFVCNAMTGDRTAIKASMTMLSTALRILAPEVMERVFVVWQSEEALRDSSTYWVSVINVGRKNSCDRVLQTAEDSAQAGQVIAGMMHVATAMATKSSVLVCASGTRQEAMHNFVKEYLESVRSAGDESVSVPQVSAVSCPTWRLKEEVAPVWDASGSVLLLDNDKELNPKIKKAYCREKELDFCPPLTIACRCLTLGVAKQVQISRKEENGGDKAYTTAEEIVADFGSGALHPGDLKPAVAKMLNDVLAPVRDAIKGDKALKKVESDLKNFVKKHGKKGGRW
mmetsp:Transcript_8068/g.17453  ORF Transcript_8068/g.17453 Transcript_8068/m.17453 type:complete len:730 (+) Transcript_8068:90-2279(+)